MLRKAFAATAAFGATCVSYGVLVERRWYRLREVDLPGALRPGADGPLRILHLSDIHLDPPQPHKVAFLTEIADVDVDLVVLTGDLLGATDAEDTVVAALAPVMAGRPGLLVLSIQGQVQLHPGAVFAPAVLTDPVLRPRRRPSARWSPPPHQ